MFPFADPENAAAVARSAVAIFFLVAGGAKLVQPKSTAAALGVLRIPDRARPPVTAALAAGELVVGTTLLLVPGRSALVAPAVMLVGFTAFLAHLSIHREVTACGCLGDLGSASAGLGLVRNVCLLSLLALATGAAAAPGLGAALAGLQVVLLLVLVTEGVHVIGKLRTLRGASHG